VRLRAVIVNIVSMFLYLLPYVHVGKCFWTANIQQMDLFILWHLLLLLLCQGTWETHLVASKEVANVEDDDRVVIFGTPRQ
jgi:hypothetical protein